MSNQIKHVDELQQFVQGALERAEHHGRAAREVIYALVGAVVAHRDPDRPICVGRSVAWVYIGGDRYVFSYNHERRGIDMRFGSTQGPTIFTFDNESQTDVYAAFKGLTEKKEAA